MKYFDTIDLNPGTGGFGEDIDFLQSHYLAQLKIIETQFIKFDIASRTLLEEVLSMLTDRLSTNPVILQEKLDIFSAHSYTLGQFAVDGKVFLQIYEIIFHTPKMQKFSEADRKKTTLGKTLRQDYILNSLSNAEEKLDNRITICQSILKSETNRLSRE